MKGCFRQHLIPFSLGLLLCVLAGCADSNEVKYNKLVAQFDESMQVLVNKEARGLWSKANEVGVSGIDKAYIEDHAPTLLSLGNISKIAVGPEGGLIEIRSGRAFSNFVIQIYENDDAVQTVGGNNVRAVSQNVIALW